MEELSGSACRFAASAGLAPSLRAAVARAILGSHLTRPTATEEEAMRPTRKRTRALGALTATLVLALLAALLLAGAALAAGHAGSGKGAKPGRPTAKAPQGTIATTTPSFTWSKARGAASYELRVYQGKNLLLAKTGIRQLTWTSSLALPINVDLPWKVRGRRAGSAGAWSKSLAFTIVPLSPEKAITAFSFQGLAPPVTGVINETLHTIALTVPYGTNLTALVATFTTTGASVAIAGTPQVSGTTINNFTNPVTYTVTAADSTTQAYTVTVASAGSPAKAITAFSFQGLAPPVVGAINEAAHTVALTVPYGTSLAALVATFTTTGASVTIAGTPQVSGVTANSFTNPVTYTVAAGDGTTQAYTVAVTVAAPMLAIGDPYQGGKIAYIDGTGEHGLIAASADQLAGMAFSNIAGTLIGPAAQGTAIGTGLANTAAIVGQAGCTSGAAYVCYNLTEGGYSDWYLPSKDELNQLYLSRVAIGGFEGAGYWSSSEVAAGEGWEQAFPAGNPFTNSKSSAGKVRAVRAF